MNLILHQFKTDVIHFRGRILTLWIAFVAETLLALFNFLPGNQAGFAEGLILAWQVFSGVFLVTAVIQADPLVGTSAAWLSRPIRRRHLFWSKSLFLLAIVLLPKLAAQSIGCALRGFSIHLILCAVAETLLYSSCLVLCIAVLASLTGNLSRFFLTVGATTAGVFTWIVIVEMLKKIGVLRSVGTVWNEMDSMKASQLIVSFFFLAVCSALAWIVQARFRGARVALVFLAAGLMAFPVLNMRWHINFLKPRLTAISPGTVQLISSNAPATTGAQMLFSEISVLGVQTGQVAVVQNLMASIRFEGEQRKTTLTGFPREFHQGRQRPGNSRQAINYVREIERFFPRETIWFNNGNWGFNSGFDSSALQRFNGHPPPGNLSGFVEFDLYRIEKVAELPLQPAVIVTRPGQRVSIRHVRLTENAIVINLDERSADLPLNRDPNKASGGRFGQSVLQNAYVLYHPASGDAFMNSRQEASYPAPSVLSAEERLQARLEFSYSPLRQKFAGISAKEWLQGAKLYVFTASYAGTSQTAFRDEHFMFPETGASPFQRKDSENPALDQLTLPAQPTPAQLNAYLDGIFFNAPDNVSYELMRKKLAAVGTNGLPVLLQRLPIASRFENYALNVVRELITRPQIPDLLVALERDSRVARVFTEKRWDEDALPVVLRKLTDHREVLPSDALMIAALSNDPATYPDLRWHFVRQKSGRGRLIARLEKCPGFDVSAAIREAWERSRLGLASSFDLALPAAKIGVPDSLAIAVSALSRDKYLREQELPELARLTGYRGDLGNELHWLATNLERFQFDRAQNRYVLSGN